MDDYKSNSHRSRENTAIESEPRKPASQVVSGEEPRKKKGVLKLIDMLVSNGIEDIGTYIVSDVIMPAISETLHDIMTNAADMLFGTGRRIPAKSGGSKIAYNSCFNNNRRRLDDEPEPSYRSKTSDGYPYDDILFKTRGDAEYVIDSMNDRLEEYHDYVTIGDMFDFAGVSCPAAYRRYGWTDVSMAAAVRTRYGDYVIRLPSPTLIN